MNESKLGKTEIKLNLPTTKAWVAIVISIALALMFLYFSLPVLSFRFTVWIMPLAISLSPLAAIPRIRKYVFYLLALLGVWLIIVPFFSSGIFNAGAYRRMIGKVESTNFTELVSPVNLNQVPIVDQAFARALADKKLGDDFALGSRVKLDKPTIQMVNGSLYWVSPLQHSGFFKWLSNRKEGTPGYVMVSATNPQDVRFIRELNGKPIRVVYQRNAYFGQNLYRHLYLHGYTNIGMAGDTFELDDKGEPYWTITLYSHRIGVQAPEATALVTVHAETGKISHYPLLRTNGAIDDSKIPAWVDRVQPSYFVIPQLSWWGKYVRGFWNTVFGKRDMLMTTQGFNVIYGNDGRSYFYTGLSSVGSDEGTVGFTLTDTRNKNTHLYRVSGATEHAAMRSAEGKVQNFGYRATFPILVNLNSKPTYFMTLKDSAGLVKMFCFVSVKDFSLVGVGESIKAARDNYQMALASSRVGSLVEGSASLDTVTGRVVRIGSDIKDGRTFYYFSLQEHPGLLFIATSNLSSYLPITTVGDELQLTYLATTDKEISLNTLKNLSLGER